MGESTKILVVEDEGVVAKDLQMRLRKLGYDVPMTVQTGEAAIQAAKELRPALILMDIRLKGDMDGIETSAKIMEQSRTPVIFLTAYADENTLGRAKLTEPYGFILKPFNERELHTAIQVALYRHGAEAALRKSERWLAGTLRGIREGIIAVDNNQRVLFMNPVAQALTGWTEPEATGQSLRDVFRLVDAGTGEPKVPAVDHPIERHPSNAPAIAAVELSEDGVLISRAGERIPIEDNAAPILDDDGHVTGGVLVFRDISARKQAQQAQRDHEDQLRSLADSMSQLAWIAKPDGRTVWYNKRWYEYTGVEPGETDDWNWSRVQDQEMLPKVVERWKQSVATGTMFDMEFPLRRFDGAFRWFLTRCVPVSDASGRIIRWFGTNTDIHDAREIREQLQRANISLAQFAYSASHDLREPLRNICLYSQLLKTRVASALDGQSIEFLGYVTEGAIRMDKLVRDLLLYAESGNASAPLDTVDTAKAVADVLAGLRVLLAESGAQVIVGDLPAITIRPAHFSQLIQNLIENAIRYKSATAPVIQVAARLNGGEWNFSVQDNGVGIEPRNLESVFGLFKRLSSSREHPGTGLGLALCRNIVQLYGGRIWAESTLGKGSTFVFSLPR